MIIIIRDKKRIEELSPRDRRFIRMESELEKEWLRPRLSVGTFYSYSFNNSFISSQLKSPEKIEEALNSDGCVVYLRVKQRG